MSSKMYIGRMKPQIRNEFMLFMIAFMPSVIIGMAIVDLLQEFTIGILAKKIGLPVIFFCILLTVVSNKERLPGLRNIFQWESFPSKIIPLLLILAICMGIVVSLYGYRGLTYAMIGVICLAGLVYSFIYSISKKGSWGISILLLIYPLILFLQHQFKYLLWEDPYEIYSINIFKPSEIVWIIIFLLVIIRKFINKDKIEILAIQKYFLLLGFLIIISAIFSPIPLTSLKFPYRDVLLPLIFLTIFLEVIKTRDDFEKIFKFFTISAILELAIIFYFFLQLGGTREDELFRSNMAISASGVVGIFGVISSQVAPTCYSLVSYNKKKGVMYWVYLFAMLAALFVILSSRARGLQIAILIVSPVLLIKRGNRLIYFFIIFLVVSILLFIPHIREIAYERFLPWFQGSNIYERIWEAEKFNLDIFHTSWRIFMDHSLWGIGWGMWNELINRYWSQPIVPNGPHSLPLTYFVYSGTGGGIIFILLWLYIIKKCIKLLVVNRKNDLAFLIIGLVWLIISNFLAWIVRGSFVFNVYGYTFIPVCLVFAVDKVLTEEKKEY